MAGDWIQKDTNLRGKAEFIRLVDIAAELDGFSGIPDWALEHAVEGILMGLWSWVDGNTDDGFFPGLTPRSLTRKHGACPEFWEAMASPEINWLGISDEGITIPGFETRFSQGAKRRIKEAKRKAESRTNEDGRNMSARMRTESGHDADLKKRREEESKEEQKEGTPDGGSLSGGGSEKKFIPDKVDLPFPSEAFASAWAEWCIHRVEIKRKLTPKAVEKQLKAFSQMGEARAIAAIDNTIQNGWIGIREPEQPRAGPNGKPSPPDPTQRKLPAMR